MSLSPKFDLLLPGVFDRLPEWMASYIEKPEAPNLVSLLQKADHQVTRSTDYETTVWQLFHPNAAPDSEIPAGRLCGDLEGEVVCRADPVHLTAGISDLLLIEASQLNLEADELELLRQLVNDHVQPVGGVFSCTSSAGVLAFEQAPPLQSTAPSRVAGNGVDEFLPAKGAAGWWPRLLNEFQMLMFNSELNRLREQRGKPAINGLWLWGGGAHSDVVESSSPFMRCFVRNEPLLEALITESGITAEDEFIADETFFSSMGSSTDASRILCLNAALLPLAQYDDFFAWQEKLLELDEALIKPLKHALSKGEISELVIHFCNGLVVSLQPRHRWKFWRRSRSLASYSDR